MPKPDQINLRFFVKNALVFLFILSIFLPVLSSAAGQFIPCGDHGEAECDFPALLTLIKNVINWIITISIPVASLVFAWAGFKLMTTGVSDQKAEAKKMLWKVFWGFCAILASWLIVNTILDALLATWVRGSIKLN